MHSSWRPLWLALLFLPLAFDLQATVTLEMTDNAIIVKTDEKGLSGYHGCGAENLQLVPAYIYSLYRKIIHGRRGKKSECNCNADCTIWIKVAQKESNLAEEVFFDMPEGEYKATVLVGQAIGCAIDEGIKDHPDKSIVYFQDKSTKIKLTNEATANSQSLLTANASSQDLKVFPNPTSGELHIQVSNSTLRKNATVVFYDLLGHKVMISGFDTYNETQLNWIVDLSHFVEGAYLLRVFDDEGHSYEQKVIVQNQ